MPKRAIKPLPNADFLRRTLSYNKETGELLWNLRLQSDMNTTARGVAIWNGRYAGKSTGCLMWKGYLTVTINYQRYFAHRIIWKFMTGTDPIAQIDHINGKKNDNRWSNLRPAAPSQNMQNIASFKKKTLPRGVWRNKVRFGASINANNVKHYLGTFDTPEEAHAAYAQASKQLHGEFGRID